MNSGTRTFTGGMTRSVAQQHTRTGATGTPGRSADREVDVFPQQPCAAGLCTTACCATWASAGRQHQPAGRNNPSTSAKGIRFSRMRFMIFVRIPLLRRSAWFCWKVFGGTGSQCPPSWAVGFFTFAVHTLFDATGGFRLQRGCEISAIARPPGLLEIPAERPHAMHLKGDDPADHRERRGKDHRIMGLLGRFVPQVQQQGE